MLFDRQQHVREPAEHVRADRLELEQARQPNDRQLVDRDREMIGPEMNQPLDERACCGQRGVEPRRVHYDIVVADGLSEIALGGVFDRCRLRLRGCRACRHRGGLHPPLGAARHLLLLEIVGELRDDLGPCWNLRQRLRARLERLHLLDQPALWIGRRLLVGAGAEAKPIEGDRCGEHPRLLSPLNMFNSAEPPVKAIFTG